MLMSAASSEGGMLVMRWRWYVLDNELAAGETGVAALGRLEAELAVEQEAGLEATQQLVGRLVDLDHVSRRVGATLHPVVEARLGPLAERIELGRVALLLTRQALETRALVPLELGYELAALGVDALLGLVGARLHFCAQLVKIGEQVALRLVGHLLDRAHLVLEILGRLHAPLQALLFALLEQALHELAVALVEELGVGDERMLHRKKTKQK